MSISLDQFIRFAKDVKHKHNFVDGKCEFCLITPGECDHNKKNIWDEGLGNKSYNAVCSCGKREKFVCHHTRNGRDIVETIPGQPKNCYPKKSRCSRCKTELLTFNCYP